MTGQRHIIIGDVHGCYEEFRALLDEVQYDKEKDTAVSLGDLIDRGPKSADCLELALDEGLILITANHEDRLLRWKQREEAIRAGSRSDNDITLHRLHRDTLRDLNQHPRSEELWRYMQNSHLVYEFQAGGTIYHCIHGGYSPHLGSNTPKPWLIRMRGLDPRTFEYLKSVKGQAPPGSIFWATAWRGPQTVVFGHNVFKDVALFDKAIGIDTGVCFGLKLTALIVEPDGTQNFVSVPAKKNYIDRNSDGANKSG